MCKLESLPMQPENILESYVVHTKKKRVNSGFEPCFNAYFDFYVSPRYLDPPLLNLEDVSLHLFMRKNFNPDHPTWTPPGVKQIMKRLDISYSRFTKMTGRLETAQLLKIVSGLHQGDKHAHVANEYILVDPIQSQEEFLTVAAAGIFGRPLREEWLERVPPYREKRDSLPSESRQPPTAEIATHNRQLTTEQTGWDGVLEQLEHQLPAATYQQLLDGSTLLRVESGIATIVLTRAESCDWAQRQLANNVRRLLTVELQEPVRDVQFIHQE
jgi:hypothetical protein